MRFRCVSTKAIVGNTNVMPCENIFRSERVLFSLPLQRTGFFASDFLTNYTTLVLNVIIQCYYLKDSSPFLPRHVTCCCCNIPDPLASLLGLSTVLVSTTLHPSQTSSMPSSCRVAALLKFDHIMLNCLLGSIFCWINPLVFSRILFLCMHSNPIQNSKHNTSASYFFETKKLLNVWPITVGPGGPGPYPRSIFDLKGEELNLV